MAEDPDFRLYTATQWRSMIDHDHEWATMLDGIDDAGITHLLGWLAHRDPDVRRVACDMIGCAETGARSHECLGRLRALADQDPDSAVRECAADHADALAEDVAWKALRAELPWVRGKRRRAAARPRARCRSR